MNVPASTQPRAAEPAGAEDFDPAPLIPLIAEAPARLIVDAPLPELLALGRVVAIRYRTENLRIVPVFGLAALQVSPRIGHLHVTVDDASWHWVDASDEPLVITGLLAGPHRVLVELADPTHRVIDSVTVRFTVPERPASGH